MVVERDWLGRDWKTLRSQLIKLCLVHEEVLLNSMQAEGNILLDSFLEAVREDIEHRIMEDRIGMWQYTLSLLVRLEWLQKELNKDRGTLCKGTTRHGRKVTPKQALARKLTLFFEMNRRQNLADELGVSSNRVKTWERLDRISRKISQQHSGSRCREGHFDTLAAHIKIHHPKDKNLPRKAKTIKGYFYRFSNECMEHIDNDSHTMDKLTLHNAKSLLQGVGMEELSRCLQELSKEYLEIIDVVFQLDITKIQYLSIEHFMSNRDLQEEQFKLQQVQALQQLRDCLELRIAARQGGNS